MAYSNKNNRSRLDFNEFNEVIDREIRRETREEDMFAIIWGIICLFGFVILMSVFGIAAYHYGRNVCTGDEAETIQKAKLFFNQFYNLTQKWKNNTLEMESFIPSTLPDRGGEYDYLEN